MPQKFTISKEQNDKLLQNDRQLADMLPVLDSLEECGEPCDSARAFINEARSRIAAIRKNFGPNPLQY